MSAATTSMNGNASAASTSSSKPPSSASPVSSNIKQQLKTTAAPKSLDTSRKQAASPVDPSSTKKAPQKAWQGPNPIIQRAAATTAPNGVSNGSVRSTAASVKLPPQTSSSPPITSLSSSSNSMHNNLDKHAHDRMLFLLANFSGLHGRVTLINGEKFEGIFAGASLDSPTPSFNMKMTKRTSSPTHTQTNGSAGKLNEYIGTGEDHIMAFDLQDTIDLNVRHVQLSSCEVKAQNGGPSFRTDAEISGIKNIRERELQPWQPGPDTDVDLSLDASGVGGWDQFAANEKLYNVRTDYDENLYTTTIDRSNPRYKQLEAEAKRIANEIERSEPVNTHVAEERRMNAKPDAGLDEEDKYSGVRRDYAALPKGRAGNAYVPPSLRPITSQPTVPGAPFDPAIISSQIARPALNTANNSDSQTTLSSQPIQSNLETDDATKAVAAAQLATEAPKPAENASPAAPTITVDGAAQSAATSKPAPASSPRRAGEGGTEGMVNKVLDSFKQFSNTEKLKYQQHQRAAAERSRVNVRQEKSVKLNDLKKFAKNFKLYSRVPDDLVPILAKSKDKQQEIVSKADQQARDKEQKAKATSPVTAAAPLKPQAESAESKAMRVAPVGGRFDTASDPNQRQRMSQNFRTANQPAPSPRGPGMVNNRFPPTASQRGAGIVSPNMPSPLQMPNNQNTPNAQGSRRESGVMSPSSAASTRLNVKATEFVFKPNPAASTFTPGPGKNSPDGSERPAVSTAVTSTVQFFSKDVKPPSERASFEAAFNPIKRMAEKAVEDNKAKDFAINGGIPQAYRTPPTWEHPEANVDKSYADAFQKTLAIAISPLHTPSNGGLPYQNQLPLPLQGVPPMPSTQHTPRFQAPQPYSMPNQHMDDQRMHYASSNSSVQPSPRMGHPAMAYPGQMHPQMANYPGGMPPYGMSPAMQMRPMPAGPQFAPQVPQAMGGQMMVQQASNGPYMNGPMGQQMPMYPSPAPGHVQPHFPGHPQQAGPYGGGPHSHPMRHQGSQQGHAQAPMYMMPQGNPMMMQQQHPGHMAQMRGGFPQPQFQSGPYPMQHRAMSGGGGGYNNHMTPRQHHAVPQGPSPGNGPPMHANGPSDEGK